MFHLVSVFTTTGFTSSGFHWWPAALPVGLLVLSFLGGCAGSTAGGIKLLRILLLYKQGKREIVRLVHPRAEISIKLGGMPISNDVMNSVWAFFLLLYFELCGHRPGRDRAWHRLGNCLLCHCRQPE